MENLLKETENILAQNGKTFGDVLWCGTVNEFMSVAKFKELAAISYDDGFGAQEIATDLIVVGKDFWLERHEYDGSEWWEFKTMPVKPKKEFNGSTVCNGDCCATLEEMNRAGGKYGD